MCAYGDANGKVEFRIERRSIKSQSLAIKIRLGTVWERKAPHAAQVRNLYIIGAMTGGTCVRSPDICTPGASVGLIWFRCIAAQSRTSTESANTGHISIQSHSFISGEVAYPPYSRGASVE
jgi:hypothetical protein